MSGTESKEPLLSICIPTYNRAEMLDNTLQLLINDHSFDERVEVIVSDNCSTDNTEEVVKKYPLVCYYKNEKNIKDRNFWHVLNYATGKYVRLFNDTLSFKPGALGKMLDLIEQNASQEDQVNLFFYDNNTLNSQIRIELKGKKEFLKSVSLFSTSIANFGCWKRNLSELTEPDRYWEYQFVQVDWCYQIVANRRLTQIYFEDFFTVAIPKNKGGYNVFDTFINKYLYIIKTHKVPVYSYEIEKYRLMRYFIWGWINSLIVQKDKRYAFDTQGWFVTLLKIFWYEPYLYPMLFLLVYRLFRR